MNWASGYRPLNTGMRILKSFWKTVVRPAGLTYGEFVAKGYLKGPDRFRLYEEKGFRTPTGKVELKLSTS